MFTPEPDEEEVDPSFCPSREGSAPSLPPVPGPLLSGAAAAPAVRAWDTAVGSPPGVTLCEPEVSLGAQGPVRRLVHLVRVCLFKQKLFNYIFHKKYRFWTSLGKSDGLRAQGLILTWQ